jgi:SHAQKYF class myb-like DNA-binding protein
VEEMSEYQQQPASSPNDNVGGSGVVGNSVVNDLMRVYENLTQSSTPQAGVPDASKALSLAYNNSGAPPQSPVVPAYQPPAGFPIPQNVFQQQQQETTANNPLHVKSEAAAPTMPPSYNNSGGMAGPNMNSYQQQQQQQQHSAGNPGYVQVPMRAVMAVSLPEANKVGSHHTQNSGEDSHTVMRTSSIASKSSQISSQNQHQPPADDSSESGKSAVGGRSRRKRKQQFHNQNDGGSASGSGGGGGKKIGRSKKSKKEDGRWSKRFTWPEDLHRDFVSAIFDVGLKHSSPSTIMEHMPKHEEITTERIKSHLQKYRLHRVKSKKEFISSYEASLRNFQQSQNNSSNNLVSGGAEVAAHLTASNIGTNKVNTGTGSKEGAPNNVLATVTSADPNQKQQQQLHQSQNNSDGNDSLMLPQLTEAEKSSPIGAAMGYLMGLFFSLKQQLMIQRSLEAAGEKAKGNVLFSPSTAAMTPIGSSNIAPNDPSSAATAAAVAAGVEFAADGNMQQSQHQNGVRSNIEVNSMMKREMQNQMALQNKMRALKQQELDKYKNIIKGAGPATAASDAVMTTVAHDGANPHLPAPAAMDDDNMEGNFAAGVSTSEQQQHTQQHHQHQQEQPPAVATGEMAGAEFSAGAVAANNNMLGIDTSDDFWNTDVVDDQLFEFLMNS